ncbi:MAG: error-prone DNA polymerase [Magnetovibrionaceae bacterium]
MTVHSYAELDVISNFSFLRGASHADELVAQAELLGLKAIGIADRNSLAGVVRGHVAAKEASLRFLPGARLVLADGPEILCYPTDRAAYGRLSRLLSMIKRRAAKDEEQLFLGDLTAEVLSGQQLIVVPPETPNGPFIRFLSGLRGRTDAGRLSIAASTRQNGRDDGHLAALDRVSEETALPLVATNAVCFHSPARRPLADVMACIRHHCTLIEAGFRLSVHAERHLKSPREMARLFKGREAALARSLEIVEDCRFSLSELAYDYPVDPVPDGETPQTRLEKLSWEGAHRRYPSRVPDKIRHQIAHELDLIGQLKIAPYFLTVHDIVSFARARGILCQGRGSAANSAVCFALGITSVDPARVDVLFERFVSAARDEPPDIDVDFEHERREEVIQYVYQKYGRDRAGMTGTTITYRTKSAIREVAKAFGLTDDAIVALQQVAWRRSWDEVTPEKIAESGLDPRDHTVRLTLELARELMGFPRHLSQHTGGMVITRSPLTEVVPVLNAAMEDRTAIEWNKDDLDALGILKIDILGLGMLSCIRRAFGLIAAHEGRKLSLASVPAEDPKVYDMLSAADSVGVFQVESRAQMTMLPRLKPRCFYDLVIEVAIVRPGPIQGDMVHPYLRRRSGLEDVRFPSKELEGVLGKTLGVPLFQEQAMKIAIVAAGFSPEEADRLRRAMATFRNHGTIQAFRERFVAGMRSRGYEEDFAERCFRQIEGFADYGFPESHAASFALLVYVSAWLKRHYPAAFTAALLNSQPMGFYAPAQLIRDLRDHRGEVRPVDVNFSDWDCTLEACGGSYALRLGLRQIKGLNEGEADALVAARGNGYADPRDLWRRAGLGRGVLERLARADAFGSLGLNRRDALWAIKGLDDRPLPLFARLDDGAAGAEPAANLPEANFGESIADDYRAIRLSLKGHPAGVLRPRLSAMGYRMCGDIPNVAHDQPFAAAGVVTARQRPGSAKGVVFITLEDETGIANLIVWPDTFEVFRRPVLQASLMGIRGRIQREGAVIHLLAEEVSDLSGLLGTLVSSVSPQPRADEAKVDIPSRDFH